MGGGAIYGKALESLTLNTVVIDGTDAAAGAGGCISVHDTPRSRSFSPCRTARRDGGGSALSNTPR